MAGLLSPQQKKVGLLSKSASVRNPDQLGLVPESTRRNEEIKATTPDLKTILARKETIQAAPKGFSSILPDFLREGLFGTGQTEKLDGTIGFDTGLFGFLRPGGIGKGRDQKIIERAQAIEGVGTGTNEAYAKALQDIGGVSKTPAQFVQDKVNPQPESAAVPKLALSDAEKKAIRPIKIEETFDAVLGPLDIIGAGAIRKTGTKALKALSSAEADIFYRQVIDNSVKEGKTINLDSDALKVARGDLSPVDHAPYSEAVQRAYTKALQSTDSPNVFITLGGPGTGKSEVIAKSLEDVGGVILQGTGANLKRTIAQFDEARAAGKSPVFVTNVVNPESAWRFAKAREALGGHTTDVDYFINRSNQALETIKKLIEDGYPVRMSDSRFVDKTKRIVTDPKEQLAILKEVKYDTSHVGDTSKLSTGSGQGAARSASGGEVPGGPSGVQEDSSAGLVPSTANSTRVRRGSSVPGVPDSRPTSSMLPGQSPSGAPLATTPTEAPSLEVVKPVSGELSRPFEKVVDIGAKNSSDPVAHKEVSTRLGRAMTSVMEYVQDSDIRIKNLLERKDLKVGDGTNTYQKATAYPGRVAVKVENARNELETIANDMVDVARKSGKDVELVREDVNKYLQALHAPERNKALGDGAAGMTDAEAKATLEYINNLPSSELKAIKQVAEKAKKLNAEGLDLLRDSGVISDELYESLTKKYQNHVPLNRILEQDEDVAGALTARGFDVRSSGIKKAKGSERDVSDILANIQFNYEQAVLRSEKNIVDQATLGFVRENREALAGLMEVRKPKAVGETFDKRIIMERTTDPQYLQLYENGQPIWIKVNDPALAVAFKGVGREKLPTILNAVGKFTRFYAGLATRFNPEFVLPNKLRDLQETMVYMAAQKDVGFKGAAKMALKDPASGTAVWQALSGVDSPGARLYEEMRSLGGTTGGMGLSTRKDVELNLDRLIETAQSRPRQAAKAIIGYVDAWNTIFEDSTRLSVYKQALASGASKERAAFLAKEASINFNRMGRGGPVINAIWMFANASIQGSTKMVRALKNPKVAAAVTATVGASVAAVNEWNDRIDPEWRDKVTKFDRMNSLPVMLPNASGEGAHYVAIPVSWGIKPIKVMADYAYDAASGLETDLSKATSDLFSSVMDAYNPIGGTDVVSALTPTILDVPVEVVRNQQWSGAKIKPDFDKNAPSDIQYFDSLGETATGQAFIEGTKDLQAYTGISLSPADLKYAFDQYIGGAGRAMSKTANTAFGFATGDIPPADEFPFVSRFYRTRTQEEVGQGTAGDTEILKNSLQNQSRERFYKNQAAEDKYKEFSALPKEEAAKQWKELNNTDPEAAAKVAEIAKQEKKGLTYTERLMTQLGVKNGERALYVYGKLGELKTDQDRAALWTSYVDKGIITPQVGDQIEFLVKRDRGLVDKQ